MSDPHKEDVQAEEFDESKAPYAGVDAFTKLWNEMTPERRYNNVGLFVKAFNRTPEPEEFELGIIPPDVTT